MLGYAEVDTAIDVGTVDGSIGATYAESVDAAAVALAKERHYQEKRFRLLCDPARTASAGENVLNGTAPQSGMDTTKLLTYAAVGVVGFLIVRSVFK